jgi:hypothetical protein
MVAMLALVVTLAAGRGEFVQACDQLDAAGGRVLSDAGDPLVPGIGAMSSPCASSQAKAIYPIFDEASAALDRAGQFLSAHLAGAERVTGERKAERKLSS